MSDSLGNMEYQCFILYMKWRGHAKLDPQLPSENLPRQPCVTLALTDSTDLQQCDARR